MRRLSLLLALAVLLILAGVGYTYKLRLKKNRGNPVAPTPVIVVGHEASAPFGWQYHKDDPATNKPLVWVDAQSFDATKDPSTFELHGLSIKLYNKEATSYTFVQSEKALFDEGSGLLKSSGPVVIVMNVPIAKEGSNKAEAAKRVQVHTSGVIYETKSGKASTDQVANFVFPDGTGTAIGAEYDPNTKILHLKSQVSLDWVGKGPVESKMHVDTNDLVYKEAEQKIYMTPIAKLKRQTTTIECQNAVVTLQDQVLHQIDGDHAFGEDARDDRKTGYAADKMTALFNEDGVLVNMVGDHNARVTSTQPESKTTLTSDRADMRFTVEDKQVAGQAKEDSTLHLVLADGHALAVAEPIATQPGKPLPDTRSLRSEHIELELKPGGRDLKEIRTSSQAQLEFKPNQPLLPHRTVDASHLRVLYGEGSYVDTFLAWNPVTRTDKPVLPNAKGKPASGPPTPSMTWSDELTARFQPNTNQVAAIEQKGHFRYQEGARKASSKSALFDQLANRMTLIDTARVQDDTGSAYADKIIMNQTSGDMDAFGNVFSTHAPDKNEKPGTSMLDNTKSMQAKADTMLTRDNNTTIHYEGHAVMWQGANRTLANVIDIDRNEQTLHANGNVVSELLDNDSSNHPAADSNLAPVAETPPQFTTIFAPDLVYRDDKRIADYTGGVKLLRNKAKTKMTILSKELLAYLTPKTPGHDDDSSLDHAFALGDVTIFSQLPANRTRTSNAEHCEYWAKDGKVVLNGGSPQMSDSVKGITRGEQLTYFNDDDRLIVDGQTKKRAFTQMKMK